MANVVRQKALIVLTGQGFFIDYKLNLSWIVYLVLFSLFSSVNHLDN